MKYKLILLIIFSSSLYFAQSKDIDAIFKQIKTKLNKVDDYSAEINISVKMDFLKMPKSKAEIFFKKPDKFKLKSSSFAILPKTGIDFNPQRILDYDFSSEFIGDTLEDDSKLSLYKIVPVNDTLKFQSAVLAIDQSELLIKKIILSAKNNAKVLTKFEYDAYKEFALPSKMEVTFDFSKVEEEPNQKRRNRNIPKDFSGKITITYNEYIINQGVDDIIFLDEEENKKNEETIKEN